jgi:hypothetical protein
MLVHAVANTLYRTKCTKLYQREGPLMRLRTGRCPVAPWHARRRGRGVLEQSGGACHTRPDAVPACCRAAELCTDASALLPLRIGTEAQQLRLGQSALTRGPPAPAAELSPAATTCAPGWHSDAVLLPAPCGPMRTDLPLRSDTSGASTIKSRRWLLQACNSAGGRSRRTLHWP